MVRGRILGGCTWILGGLALLQTLYLRALPPPAPGPRPPPRGRAPRGVLDASGSFRVYRDVLGTPPGWARAPRPELVLATHGSPGRGAAALGGPWGGPVSLAVFGEPREGLRELLEVLGGPCRALRARLRLHVVLGAAGPPPKIPEPPRGAPQRAGGCRGALGRLEAADPPSYTLGVPYPGNLLRNVAWEGAAGGGGRLRPGGPPPKLGERFVLMVDADVVPSPGLREGFLQLLRDGGLHPKNWGGQGEMDLENWGGLHPKNGGAEGEPGNPKAAGAQGDLGAQGDSGHPKILGGPDSDPTVTNTLGVPRRLGGANGVSDPGVPDGLGVPEGLGNLGVPSVPKNPKSPQVPGVFNGLSDPKVQSDPNAQSDPKVQSDPNTWSDHKALSAPHALNDPHAPSDPKVLNAPHAQSDPTAPSAPNVQRAPHTWPSPADPPWSRVVFVLPAFEVRRGLSPPSSKAELLSLWAAGDARPFYGALCPRCQAPTAFGRWRGLPPAPRPRVAYEVPWRDPWEPFYVAPARGVPPFDERFLQYGFNRISQACELHVAGFRFAVLDGAFVAHRGFKEPGGFHGAREAELGRNRDLFRAFRRELRLRYPGSPRRC